MITIKYKRRFSYSNGIMRCYDLYRSKTRIGVFWLGNTSTLTLYNFLIHPPFRGRRLGSRSLDRIIRKAKTTKYTELHLYVERGNTRAINLYESRGFKMVCYTPLSITYKLTL